MALILGLIIFSDKSNATNLQSSQKLILELELAQFNLEDASKYFNSGNKRLDKGDYQGAIYDFNKAIEVNPNFAGAYINRGFAFYNLNDYQAEIADYTKAIEINPKFALAYYNRGLAFNRLKDYQGAIADFTKAIEINPNNDDN